MDLREIRYFLAVAETLNFTRAAEACGVTQPALTRAIQKLERELGGPLFARERGRTHLTALGRLVQPQLAELVARSRAVNLQAEQHRRLSASDLRLGVMCSVGPARLSGFFQRFHQAHPGVALTVEDAVPDRLAERLLAGQYDAALLSRPEIVGERLDIEPLYAERTMVACAPSHPFAERESIGMADMDGQSYLLRINCEARSVLGARLREAGARINVAVRSEREDWILSLVAAGVGVCFLPEFSATIPGVVLRPVHDAPLIREICLVTVAGRRWSPPLASFIEDMRRPPSPPEAVPMPLWHRIHAVGSLEGLRPPRRYSAPAAAGVRGA